MSFKKENLSSLALKRKGCAFADYKSSPTPIPTVVISLGGLGAETLNTLKGKFTREVGECDHIWFRMIDTDEETLRRFDKLSYFGLSYYLSDAHMESGEMIHLYDQSLRSCLAPAMIPAYIDKWLNPALKGSKIRPDGAQMTRQIGRTMLVHDSVYSRVSQNLEIILNEAIKAAFGGRVRVILIAGVSGGTGSGSVIDVAYMIHDLMRRLACRNYNLAGYIFTPDAQLAVPGIAAIPTIRANLERNGYAALKEIDYFMNLEETGGVYRLQLMNNTVECARNIFDSCTLVSGYNEAGELRSTIDTISSVTDHLMDMLTVFKYAVDGIVKRTPFEIDLGPAIHVYNAQWFYEHPQRRLYHRYASYKYQILDYNSIRIPRDEIFAYCVDRIYEGVLNEFKNFRNVNRQMLGRVFEASHTTNPDYLTLFAELLCEVDRNISLDGHNKRYNKRMVKTNPMVAYDDACEVAQSEAGRINSALMGKLENNIYDALKLQIDLIFDVYGPYVALCAIRHEKSCLTDGDPNEPFYGVYEQLIRLSDALTSKETGGRKTVDAQIIREKADIATRLLGFTFDMEAYVSECCSQAAEIYLDPVFFHALSKAVRNVAARIYDYSKQFWEYTAIMDEVQYILSKDGDYFSRGHVTGTEKLYPVDLINSSPERAKRLQHYLDDFISQVSAQDIAHLFIKSMRDNKEKWLGQQNEKNFDVAGEVRAIMDGCLVQISKIPEIVEKFVVAAYHPKYLTPVELDAIWGDNTPTGPKMQALNAAAHHILQTLGNGARAMAHSAGVIPLDEFGKDYFVSALQDTPTLNRILADLFNARYQTRIAVSNSRDKFIYASQYFGLPMYILKGMDEYNEQYVRNPAPGMHMDERDQDWSRFQNPYTIDSVALDLEKNGKHFDEIYKYPDRVILDEVEKQTRYGLQAGYVEVGQIPWNVTGLTLFDITNQPSDIEQFNKELYEEALDAYSHAYKVDLIPFMERHGFILNQVFVSAGDTDIDLSLIDFEQASAADKETKYKNIPVPVEDVYKWLRKSIRYMDILEKDYELFKELEEVLKMAAADVDNCYKYRRDIETFALALITGLVRRKGDNQNMWEYMCRNKPVNVNLRTRSRFDRKFFLYHVFVEFQKMSRESLDEFNDQAKDRFMKGKMADPKEISFITDHIKEMLKNDCLGDRFNLRSINEEAITESDVDNYQVTDETENAGNPFLVLKRFYTRIMCLME